MRQINIRDIKQSKLRKKEILFRLCLWCVALIFVFTTALILKALVLSILYNYEPVSIAFSNSIESLLVSLKTYFIASLIATPLALYASFASDPARKDLFAKLIGLFNKSAFYTPIILISAYILYCFKLFAIESDTAYRIIIYAVMLFICLYDSYSVLITKASGKYSLSHYSLGADKKSFIFQILFPVVWRGFAHLYFKASAWILFILAPFYMAGLSLKSENQSLQERLFASIYSVDQSLITWIYLIIMLLFSSLLFLIHKIIERNWKSQYSI
jgi:hypothetical protein